MPRQKLGQNFLTDASWRERIAATLSVSPGSTWLEIGAGHGEMTGLLARRSARVLAVEIDPRLLPRLRERTRDWPNVEVVAGDILQQDLAALPFTTVPAAAPLHVYGNLPYYITSPILHHLFRYAGRLAGIHAVVQWEVAQRILSPPSHRAYGYLSVLVQYYTQPELLLRIPPGAFRPRPKVISALVHLPVRRTRTLPLHVSESEFLDFVKTCFAQKRKTLVNNLRATLGELRARALLESVGLRSDARAEQLSVVQFIQLFSAATSRSG